MKYLIRLGRLFYGLGMIAIGTHQLVIKKFRPEILPPFPEWPHDYSFFPILTGLVLIVAGVIISGVFKIKPAIVKNVCLGLGFGFLVVAIICHLPYMLFIIPDKIMQLQFWFGGAQALAYSGGAFVMAGSFSDSSNTHGSNFEMFLEKLIPFGKIFFSILMFIFGCSHFAYAPFVSTMVPHWAGFPMFWTYFVGVALIGASIAIIFKIWIRPVAFLLAFMLFFFFLFFHIPDAIANPEAGGGNEITRAVIALLDCGTALVIGATSVLKNQK